MKNLATVISAGLLVAASLAVSAGDTPNTPTYGGYGYGYVPPYGYAPYGYAPYGYGVPVQPPVQLNADQVKAMQEQQAKAFEYMQNVQRRMAEYYANSPDPTIQMERRIFEQRNADMQEMGKLIQETNQDIARDFQDAWGSSPAYGSEPALPSDVTARIQELEKQSQDRRKAADERRAAFMKAAEQRRLDVQKRLEERRQQYGVPAPVVDVPKADISRSDAQKS
jgi:hypothetical protein